MTPTLPPVSPAARNTRMLYTKDGNKKLGVDIFVFTLLKTGMTFHALQRLAFSPDPSMHWVTH